MRMNKRGLAFVPLIWIALALVAIYITLFLPFPAFKEIRATVNFFLIISLWILVQVLIIYLYFTIGNLVYRGAVKYKDIISAMVERFKKWLLIH